MPHKMKEFFILTLVSIIATIILASVKICFASKCKNVDVCFGILRVEREVSLERQEYQEEKNEIVETKQMQTL